MCLTWPMSKNVCDTHVKHGYRKMLVGSTWFAALNSNYSFFQILEMNPEDEAEEDGANIDLDSQRKGKCVVLKTSTRQVMAQHHFLSATSRESR